MVRSVVSALSVVALAGSCTDLPPIPPDCNSAVAMVSVPHSRTVRVTGMMTRHL